MFEELPKLPEDNLFLQSTLCVFQSCQSRPVRTMCRMQTHPVTTQCVVDSFGDSVVYVANNMFVLQTCQSCLVTMCCRLVR